AFGAWLAPACLAQQHWELGAVGGFGMVKSVSATSGAGSADAGFKAGAALGVFGGQQLYSRLGGEFRYLYRFSDLKLASSGAEVTFSGRSQMVHYDLLFFTNKPDAPVRPYAAAGGGIKIYDGTGKEAAYQPLSRFAILTKTRQVMGLASVGGGVRVKVGPRAFLRLEFRDYITPWPKDVITPAPGAKISGWAHDLVPMVGIGVSF
ncbi:MAG: outer membrane beta-barrel protein, partial [Acidobacteriota bacterium]